jgi:uncharacterized protein (TIGR01777 family)
MRIMIAGGSGLIGRELTSLFHDSGDEVVILSRNPAVVRGVPGGVKVLRWDAKTIGEWAQQLESCDAVVNLTGENLSGKGYFPKRWTKERKSILRESRVDSGNVLSEAIEMATTKPSVFVQASGINYYGTRQNKILTEEDQSGDDFLANLGKEWETSSQAVEKLGLRRIVVRNGIVLSTKGGALPSIVLPYRLWVGGPLGNGQQVYSWIHIFDEVNAIQFLIHNPQARGVYNLTSPKPLTNAEFGRTVGKVIRRPHYFPIPAIAMQIAFGEVAMTVLEGLQAIPKRLLEAGFVFKFPDLEDALKDLYRK